METGADDLLIQVPRGRGDLACRSRTRGKGMHGDHYSNSRPRLGGLRANDWRRPLFNAVRLPVRGSPATLFGRPQDDISYLVRRSRAVLSGPKKAQTTQKTINPMAMNPNQPRSIFFLTPAPEGCSGFDVAFRTAFF